ncbi:peptidase domain-containing ABC transporter [uncultured Shewanella sp.]|uniref:peptidase domain-containing ABC transporter n=1 Tax=uncultured Shewanella sp. TaxID=173975 RepID=UPI002608C167|nr:peptidase domain-containing ABC transporter [uncultured Shewanella sp.]
MSLTDYLHFSQQRLPLFLQSEVAECGMACVAMVACYHGYQTNMLAMRKKYPAGLQGMTVKQIIDVAADISLNARVLKLDLGQLERIKKPAIIHWNFNHFVTLVSCNSRGVVIHDPAKGKIKLDWEQVSQSFTGIAIELTPTSDFEQQDERVKVPILQLVSKIHGLKWMMAKIFAVALILQALFLISPYYIRLIIDQGIQQEQSELLRSIFLGFSLLLLFTIAAQAIRSTVILFLDKTLGFQIKANIQRHLLHLPLSFFESRHVGDIKSRFEAFNEVQRLISRGFITAIVDGLLSITTLAIMFNYQPQLAWVSLAFLGILYLVRFKLTNKENDILEQNLSTYAKENSHFIETVRAMMPIKCFAKENARLSNWMNLFADSTNASIQREKIVILSDLFSQFINKAEYLVIVLLGATLILDNHISLGMFMAFLAYRQQFADSTQSLVNHLFQFRLAGTYLRRMSDILMQETESSTSGAVLLQQPKGALEARNIHFRYSKNTPWLYRGLSFSISAGEFVVITGRSGLGKTTLLKLMMGLIKPEEGELLIDGASIEQLGVKSFRQLCATVMQDDQLLNGSLIENISFFEANVDIERVKEAAIGAAIWDDIQAMPMGLHSQVGDLGSALSGGQKQRILLARALYAQPKILFLDEATSHLDSVTESKVNQYLKQKQITRITVAHRQETIASADRIIDLHQLNKQEIAA